MWWYTLMFNWIRLHELTENFYDDIKFLDKDGEKPRSFGRNKRGGPFKKRKVTFFLFYYFFLKYSAFFCFCFSVSFVFDNVLFNFRRQGTDMDTPVVPLAASVHQFCCHEKDTNFRFAFMIKCWKWWMWELVISFSIGSWSCSCSKIRKRPFLFS